MELHYGWRLNGSSIDGGFESTTSGGGGGVSYKKKGYEYLLIITIHVAKPSIFMPQKGFMFESYKHLR